MSILVLIAALVAVIWVGVMLRSLGLAVGGLLVLIAGSVFGHPFFHVAAGPLPITTDRVLLTGLIILYVFYRRYGKVERRPLVAADLLLFGTMGWLLLSALSHNFRADGFQPLATLLFFYLMPAAMYWIARETPLANRHCILVFAVLAGFAAYLGVTAVAEVRGHWSMVLPGYIVSPKFPEFLGRGRGPFLNPVACGLFLTCGLSAAALLWTHIGSWSRQPAGQASSNESRSIDRAFDMRQVDPARRLARTILAACCLAAGLGIVATLTRSVWLGAAVAVLLVLGHCLPRRWWIPATATALVLAGTLVVTQWERLSAFKRDRNVSAHEMSQSAELRPILASVAWRMFSDHPLAGCGFGQYRFASLHYLGDRTSALPLEKARPYVQHNVLLALLTETGLPGMVLFAALLVSWARGAWKLARAKTASSLHRMLAVLSLVTLSAYALNGMFHEVAIIPMANMLVFFLAGLSQGLAIEHVRELSQGPARRWIQAWQGARLAGASTATR